MTIGQVFRKAKPYLWNGNHREARGQSVYICYAIKRTNASPEDIAMAKALVMHRISPYDDLEEWLSDKLNMTTLLPPKQMQQYRHAWLDQLIEEFE